MIQAPKYDLETRTTKFAEDIISICKKTQKDIVTIPILNQIMRSGTSIGADYCEANGASSKKDFKNKIFICKKESKETQYWLKLLTKADGKLKDEYNRLRQEAHELTLIFSKIAFNTN